MIWTFKNKKFLNYVLDHRINSSFLSSIRDLRYVALTLIILGGGPTTNLNDYFSATKYPIDLKPSCILKFVCCLQVYKKMINLDPGGPLIDNISLTGSILGSIWGSMKVHEGSLSLGEVQH